MNFLPGLFFLLAVTGTVKGAAPSVFEVLDPVRPDETLLLFGAHVSGSVSAEGLRLSDRPVVAPPNAVLSTGGTGEAVRLEVLQASETSAKVLIPKSWENGVYAVRLRNADGAGAWQFANRPQLWWQISGADGMANPGGEIRVFGKNLGATTRLWLTEKDRTRELKVTTARDYDVTASLPADLSAGRYRIWAQNGFGGEQGFGAPLEVNVAAARPWPKKVFNVHDFGAKGDNQNDDTFAIRRALKWAGNQGGGVVYFPPGTYLVTGKLPVPHFTVVRGESRESVWIKVPVKVEQFDAVFAGSGYFGIENLSLVARPVLRLIASPDSGGTYVGGYAHWQRNDQGEGHIALRNLRLQHLYFQTRLTGQDPRRQITEGPSAVAIKGADVEISDCVIVGAGQPIQIADALRARVQRNQLGTGRSGWVGLWNFQEGIFEENEIVGRDLEASFTAVQLTAYHVMFRANQWHDAYGCEREALTFDLPYLPEWVGSADSSGTVLTFKKPGPPAGWPEIPSGPARLAAAVISGRGVGQVIPVEKVVSSGVILQSPFAVMPDAGSVIALTACKSQVLIVDNSVSDSSVGVQLFSISSSFVIARNTFTRTGGSYALAADFYDAGKLRHISYAYFNQWLDNAFHEGLVYDQGPWPYGYVGYSSVRSGNPTTICAIGERFVGNQLFAGTRMGADSLNKSFSSEEGNAGPVASDAIFEANVLQGPPAGIEVAPGHRDTLLRENRFPPRR